MLPTGLYKPASTVKMSFFVTSVGSITITGESPVTGSTSLSLVSSTPASLFVEIIQPAGKLLVTTLML